MPKYELSQETRSDLETIKDLVVKHAPVTDPDNEAREFINDHVQLLFDPLIGQYIVSVTDSEPYLATTLDEERTGIIGKRVIFDDDMRMDSALVFFEGEKGGGFDKPIKGDSVGTFVTGMLADIQKELEIQ